MSTDVTTAKAAPKKRAYFVCGTDTGIGKTLVAASLLKAASNEGLRTIGLKPVAAGCEKTDAGFRNEDALILAETASEKLPYEQVNPLALEAAVSPHLAALKAGKMVNVDRLVGYCRGAMMKSHDFCVVEGAGGWRVPVSPRESMSDLAKSLGLPVILVVGVRLGCLNHALLTAEAIQRDGLQIAGWVANRLDPNMAMIDENVETLIRELRAPLIGQIPHMSETDILQTSQLLDINKLV